MCSAKSFKSCRLGQIYSGKTRINLPEKADPDRQSASTMMLDAGQPVSWTVSMGEQVLAFLYANGPEAVTTYPDSRRLFYISCRTHPSGNSFAKVLLSRCCLISTLSWSNSKVEYKSRRTRGAELYRWLCQNGCRNSEWMTKWRTADVLE